MDFINKKLKSIIVLLSIFFILQSSLLYYNKYNELASSLSFADQLIRSLLVISIYLLLFHQVYQLRKTKRVITILLEILALAISASVFIIIPIIYAKAAGVIPEEVGYLYILEVNLFFALFLSVALYITRHISLHFSRISFLLLINTVFFINCIAIAILYSTGFEIGPTVFLHFSWEAAKVGTGEYLAVLLIVFVALVPINIFFIRMLKDQKDHMVNYTVVSIAGLTILANSVILNFDSYKTKVIMPIFSIIDTSIRYSDSNVIFIREQYDSLITTNQENSILNSLGISLDALSNPSQAISPVEKKNIITIYLEAFQLNFTKHGDELYPGLTPNINSLSSDYVVYTNFINSVSPTINAMVTSQCGVDILLTTDVLHANNEVLSHDAVAQDLLGGNLICLSDILHNAGYYQAMMKGASMNFSGKGRFFRSHNYDQTLGVTELNTSNTYSDLNMWGLQDPALVHEALNKIDSLKNKQPFNLTFLTVNSHPPGYETPDCPIYEPGNVMLNGIHCTDYALGLFLTKLEQMDIYKNTVVVILGDHVMFNSPANQSFFKDIPLSWYGRTYLAIRSPDASLQHTSDIFGTTPDIAPTILDLLGFSSNHFISGKSLLSDRRNHQRITSYNFDIIDGKMVPDRLESLLNDCSIAEAANVKVDHLGLYSNCQRAKIHHLKQKSIYQ